MVRANTCSDCLFTVVIPTFNRARYLTDALESVIAQGRESVEIIVVDDGSTDDTRDLVNRYRGAVRYVYQRNRGAGAARNTGIRLARGRFVSFLDSDDEFLPGKMAAELDAFGTHPTADALVSDSDVWLDGNRVSTSWFRDRGMPELAEPTGLSELPALWLEHKLFATSSLTVKRDALLRTGPFDTRFPVAEDFEFSLRLHRSCGVVALPRLLTRVRRFHDETRVGRAVPGAEAAPEHTLHRLSWQYRALCMAQRRGPWPKRHYDKLTEKRRQVARSMSAGALPMSGRQRVSLALSELTRGSPINGLQVLLDRFGEGPDARPAEGGRRPAPRAVPAARDE